MKAIYVICAILFIICSVNFLLAQEFPPIYEKLFSQELLGMIAAVVGFTKLVRNVLAGVKGTWALAITIVVSVAYGIFEFGLQGGQGIYIGAGVGGLAALTFFLTKQTGKQVKKQIE